MPIHTQTFEIESKGNTHVMDITSRIERAVKESGLADGTATAFVCHSTAAITTIEYEPGLVSDLKDLFGRIAPADRDYAHNRRWGDDNGHAHLSSSLLGPSLTVPFASQRLLLGTWQQVVLVDFDIRPRSRQVVVQVMGE